MKLIHIALPLLFAAISTTAAGCKYSVESYVADSAFVARIRAACEDPPSSLYAEVDGEFVAAANVGPDEYQISWLDDFDKVQLGDYPVNLYDEAGYGQLKKLLRDGESIKSVTPVHSAYLHYPLHLRCTSSSELLACCTFVILYAQIAYRILTVM